MLWSVFAPQRPDDIPTMTGASVVSVFYPSIGVFRHYEAAKKCCNVIFIVSGRSNLVLL